MKPMYLPAVENSPAPGPYARVVEQMRGSGLRIPQILHLFAFKPNVGDALARLSQEIMRGPSPLPPGMRELIAAFTSQLNHCPF